jgi:hypothetical protein
MIYMKKNNKPCIYPLIAIGFALMIMSGCKDEDKTVPVLTTSAISNIAINTAICGGNITGGCSKVSVRGVCWSKGTTPTTADNKTNDGTGQGTFTSTITGLDSNTTYYIRAYATNCIGTGYGNTISFATQH